MGNVVYYSLFIRANGGTNNSDQVVIANRFLKQPRQARLVRTSPVLVGLSIMRISYQ